MGLAGAGWSRRQRCWLVPAFPRLGPAGLHEQPQPAWPVGLCRRVPAACVLASTSIGEAAPAAWQPRNSTASFPAASLSHSPLCRLVPLVQVRGHPTDKDGTSELPPGPYLCCLTRLALPLNRFRWGGGVEAGQNHAAPCFAVLCCSSCCPRLSPHPRLVRAVISCPHALPPHHQS